MIGFSFLIFEIWAKGWIYGRMDGKKLEMGMGMEIGMEMGNGYKDLEWEWDLDFRLKLGGWGGGRKGLKAFME